MKNNSSFNLDSIKMPDLEKGDLSGFCPSTHFQYKATCYAYAVVYTAMSTQYNIINEITDVASINDNYFSPGFLASYHNSMLPLLKRSPWCGKHGTVDKSLDILMAIGTVFSKTYDCDCKRFSQIEAELPASAKKYKIEGYQSLSIHNKENNDLAIAWIKSSISKKLPVIIGIYQYDRFYNIKTHEVHDKLPDTDTLAYLSKYPEGVSNHVICILGYDDKYKNETGYFLVKNNFEGWGDGKGFCWIPYTFLTPLIEEAYHITRIKEPS